VRRGPYSAFVTTADGDAREYDRVVLTCHADEALALLTDAAHEETEALSSITYTSNQVVLHTDERMLPRSKAARASWNYVTRDCHEPAAPLTLTYHLNRLQSLDADDQFCVSLNPSRDISPDAIIHETEFAHPRYTFATLRGQRLLRQLQGERGTYFAGAYMGYGFHEDGFVAAREVAAMLCGGP
jgi:hypothetical protein